MQVGGVFALSTEREYTVAERISQMVPAAELVRFSNSGTEAVMAALRLARAYTGKDDYVILEGSYHGLFDAAMWYTPMEKWSQVGDPQVVPVQRGRAAQRRATSRTSSRRTMPTSSRTCSSATADSIACLLIEPIMGNCLGIAAEPAYVRAARELCDRYGVVLIIDEVKTGFRVARGGVQELYGVRADLCTFAKAMANGYPISVLAGREDIMRKIGKGVAHGGTYTAHPVSLAAAEKTLEILAETDALERLAAYGTRLRSGMSAILKARGIAHSFVGHPSMSGLYFAHEPPRTYRDWKGSDYTFYDAVARVLHDERILCEPDSREPWFMSAAHDESCLKDTLAASRWPSTRTLDAARHDAPGAGLSHDGAARRA